MCIDLIWGKPNDRQLLYPFISCGYIYIYIYIYMCMSIYAYMHMYTHIYIYLYIYIHIYRCNYTFYAYIYIYIHKHFCHLQKYIPKITHLFLNGLYLSFFQTLKNSKSWFWKKPKYNSFRNKCLVFDIYIYSHICINMHAYMHNVYTHLYMYRYIYNK